MAELAIYLSVYDTASFFSDDEIAVVLALMQLTRLGLTERPVMRYHADPQNVSQTLGERSPQFPRLGFSESCMLTGHVTGLPFS